MNAAPASTRIVFAMFLTMCLLPLWPKVSGTPVFGDFALWIAAEFAVGLVTGLGWYATKHAVGLWSSAPPARPFRHVDAQPEVDALPQRAPASDAEGETTVETYTVVYGRDGTPELGIMALRTADGRRAWGNTTDAQTMASLMEEEGCGRRARLSADGRVDLR